MKGIHKIYILFGIVAASIVANIVLVCISGATISGNVLAWAVAFLMTTNVLVLYKALDERDEIIKLQNEIHKKMLKSIKQIFDEENKAVAEKDTATNEKNTAVDKE